MKRVFVAEERFFSERVPDREKRIFFGQKDSFSEGKTRSKRTLKAFHQRVRFFSRTRSRPFYFIFFLPWAQSCVSMLVVVLVYFSIDKTVKDEIILGTGPNFAHVTKIPMSLRDFKVVEIQIPSHILFQ